MDGHDESDDSPAPLLLAGAGVLLVALGGWLAWTGFTASPAGVARGVVGVVLLVAGVGAAAVSRGSGAVRSRLPGPSPSPGSDSDDEEAAAVATPSGPFCRSCGLRQAVDARFCDSCGQPLA